MHIAVLLTDLLDVVGGIQSFNRSLVKALDQIAAGRGWDVRVLALNDRRSETIGTRTQHQGFAGNRLRFGLAALGTSRKADVVFLGHVHFAPLLCVSNGARQFLVVHGIDAWKRLPAMQRWGTSRTERILSVSNFTRDRMMELNGLSAERFSIFPNTVEPSGLESRPVKPRGGHGAALRGITNPPPLPAGKMILSVARLAATERAKGIDVVIQSLPAVLRKVPDALYVVIGDGEDRSRLETLADELGLSDHVHFVGRLVTERLPDYYAACDVFALPSTKEGFGIVFLEAMSQGKPCIGARVGGVPEVIEEGKTGFLIEANDTDKLSESLVRLLSDDALRETMGGAGKERFDRHFSFPEFRRRVEALLAIS